MIALYIVFFLIMYIIMETCKYRRVRTIMECVRKREYIRGSLYNERLVFIKAIILLVAVILTVIYYFTDNGKAERSQGIRGIIVILIPYVIFTMINIRDIKRVLSGHNEKILGIEIEEEEFDEGEKE